MQHGGGITPYYTTIINSTLNLCKFMNGTDNNNPIMKWIVDSISEKLSKDLIHPCPYVGRVAAYNVSFTFTGFTTQFLRGRYKIFTRVFDEDDDNIITMKTGTEV
jgi:Protein of unknown function (DUF1091)